MNKLVLVLLFMFLFFFSPCLTSTASFPSVHKNEKFLGCNPYEGTWVLDERYPMYDSTTCPYIRSQFNCLNYGRRDQQYLKFRWQPTNCDLPRFDGVDFLKTMQGKKIMFVGDSISSNQWTSLVCLLYVSVESKNITTSTIEPVTSVTFRDYDVTVSVFLSHYLVDIETRNGSRVLNLDSLSNGDVWKEQDVLIFNTWLWWGRRDQWNMVQENDIILHANEIHTMDIFQKGLTTWANWVNTSVDPTKNRVFFQGINPMHYNGTEWNEPGVTSCVNETEPLSGSTYPAGEPLASTVVKEILGNISAAKHVELFDITNLSQLRKDGHPGLHNALGSLDCTHWCVAGVPDTWNQILYAQLLDGTNIKY